jgi:hypothetical protein
MENVGKKEKGRCSIHQSTKIRIKKLLPVIETDKRTQDEQNPIQRARNRLSISKTIL